MFAEIGQGREDNIAFTIDADESVTCHFKASGINNATDKYFDIKDLALKCAIKVNNIASITHINGHELTTPLPLGTTNWNTWRKGIRWEKITVRADSDSTSFMVYAF